ncbi:hypothetical protein D3C87_1338040 [compost metagenome]
MFLLRLRKILSTFFNPPNGPAVGARWPDRPKVCKMEIVFPKEMSLISQNALAVSNELPNRIELVRIEEFFKNDRRFDTMGLLL